MWRNGTTGRFSQFGRYVNRAPQRPRGGSFELRSGVSAMSVGDNALDGQSAALPTSERSLGALWRRADRLADGLLTEDGRRFRIVYPGRLSSRPGPDFVDAVLTTDDGTRITGDIELHLRAPDWYHHHHADDPNYNAVVLHVVVSPRGQATSRQQSGMRVPVASVAHLVPDLQREEPDRTPVRRAGA